jgi:hypothetical protein
VSEFCTSMEGGVHVLEAKRCRGCGVVKPVGAFWKNRSKSDGLQDYCKPCHGEKIKKSIERRGAPYPNYRQLGKPPGEDRRVRTVVVDGMKPCRKCGETKPLGDFYRSATTPSGVQYWCKACQNAAARVPRKIHVSAKPHTKEALPAGAGQIEGQTPSGRCVEEPDTRPVEGSILSAGTGSAVDVFICDRGDRGQLVCHCGAVRSVRCGFPKDGGKCGQALCDKHAHEIRPGLEYCDDHFERAQDALAALRRRQGQETAES